IFSFFFQAEDGIRDFHVTGVQTCALPISLISGIQGNSSLICRQVQHIRLTFYVCISVRNFPVSPRSVPANTHSTYVSFLCKLTRSEERRVGREAGSRRWTYHRKDRQKVMG